MLTTTAYLTYIFISVLITIFVSRTLSKNGEVFLIHGFKGDRELAQSVNHLLVVGFYLLNLGFVLLKLEASSGIHSLEKLLIYLSSNLGLVLFILGIMHFFNMYVITRFRRSQLGVEEAAKSGDCKTGAS